MLRSRSGPFFLGLVPVLFLILSPGAQVHSVAQVAPAKVDSILILKKDHILELLSAGNVIRTYKVALGRGGLVPKQREGDERTPEGHYIID